VQKEVLTKEALTNLQKEAEKAHVEYEYALCHRDPDWATTRKKKEQVYG
jgi:hypothetical protein